MNFEMKCLDLANTLSAELNNLLPCPDISDRDYWASLPEALKTQITTLGDCALADPIPSLYATDFMAFKRTGNRVEFETKYFKRRHMLNDLVIAECLLDSGKYLDKIVDLLISICEESSWVLPAHNSYIRNAPQIILPDTLRPVIDLFACETAAQLATVRFLLGARLDDVSALVPKRIADEVHFRAINPYLNEHFWWMGCQDEPMCNWTSWCTQNILIAAFISDYPIANDNEKLEIFKKASASCDYFLKDYGEDGCCDEGPHYFRHAGLCLFGALDILNTISDCLFTPIFADEKIKNIAAYISNLHIEGPYYFNFADCSPLSGRCGVREYLFGKATDQDFLMDFAALDFKYTFDNNTTFEDESQKLNLFYRLQTINHASEVLAAADKVSTCPVPPDIFYKSVGIFTARTDSLALAVKAGDNDDSHNHNDTGSVILYKNGKPVLVDIGVETYTQKTFSDKRYEIWTMQSCYHNLPTINGLDEADGADYMATDVNINTNEDIRSISMNIATAYPDKTLKPYIRTVTLDKKTEAVTISDSSENTDIIYNFITYYKPEAINDNSLKIGDATLTFEGISTLEIEALPITDARLKIAWDHELYRLKFSPQSDSMSSGKSASSIISSFVIG